MKKFLAALCAFVCMGLCACQSAESGDSASGSQTETSTVTETVKETASETTTTSMQAAYDFTDIMNDSVQVHTAAQQALESLQAEDPGFVLPQQVYKRGDGTDYIKLVDELLAEYDMGCEYSYDISYEGDRFIVTFYDLDDGSEVKYDPTGYEEMLANQS